MTARVLTPGEEAAARAMFGDALPYHRPMMRRGKWIVFQPPRTAMAPRGVIHFPDAVYRDDFSTDVDAMAWLIHELTHVWQHARGVNLILKAPFARRYDYGRITAETRFDRLNIEQQAALVADAFYLTRGYRPVHGEGSLADYRRVMPFGPR